ncbi:MFS transporter [Methylorubrum zatmanii]
MRPSLLSPAARAALPLYVAFGAILGFVQTALPTILQREGLPLAVVGFATLLFLPFGLSVLWAPLVDRYGSTRFGRRRSWILGGQAAVVACLAIAWALTPQAAMLLFLPMGIAAATMDVALDGYLVETARSDADRALRGPLKVGGMFAGMLIGSTAILGLYEHLGWDAALVSLAILALAAPVGFVRNRADPETGSLQRAWPAPMALLRRQGGARLVAASVALGISLGLGISSVRLLLVAIGLPLGAVGFAFGVAGGSAAVAGAVIGAALGQRFGTSRLLLATSATLAALFCGAAIMGTAFPPLVVAASLFVSACIATYAILYATLCALAMRICASHQAATDYALFQSCWTLAGILGGVVSGSAVTGLGWTGALLIAGLGIAAPAFLISRTERSTALQAEPSS